MGVVSLIVMEPGSQWPGHVRDSENIVAVGHDPDGLVDRTRQTLASLRTRGQQVRVAVLACNEATDVASVATRAQLAQELLTAVAGTRFGRLVLTSVERASVQLRRELLSLVGALSHSLRGASVRVTFNETAGHRRGPTLH
jgi:hypothetical protein